MYILLYLNSDEMPAMMQAASLDELSKQIVSEFPDYIAHSHNFDEVAESMTLYELDKMARRFIVRDFDLCWRPHISV